MNRETLRSVVTAAIEGQKEKAAYLLEHINDPDVVCYLPKGNVWESTDGKIFTQQQLDTELSIAKKYGQEVIAVDFTKAV